MTYGGDGPVCRLLCGGFGLDALPDPLRPLLPTVITLDSQAARVAPWLEPIFDLLRVEAEDGAPGAKAVFAKIADVFLTQALRSFLIGIEDAGLAGIEPLLDPQMSEAINLIHNDPTHGWTTAELATRVHMSRSSFNDRFRDLVGDPPIQYVTRVRLSRAASYLATTNLSVFAIAQLSGYTDDAALSKAFKRSFGLSPGEYRSSARHHPLLTATLAA